MTVQELTGHLKTLRQKLEDSNIAPSERRELENLIIEAEDELEVAAASVLQTSISVPDTKILRGLSDKLEQEIQNERKRVQLIKQIVNVARKALSAAGLRLPSII